MQEKRTADFHAQDWALIVEALAHWAPSPDTIERPREERAWHLIELIAAEQGLTPSDLIVQIDDCWSGPE